MPGIEQIEEKSGQPPAGTIPLARAILHFAGIAENHESYPSLAKQRELEAELATIADAQNVTFDYENAKFRFEFSDRVTAPTPWSLLDSVKPRVPSSDGTYLPSSFSEQTHRMRAAIQRVWAVKMIGSFNEAVLRTNLQLYARIERFTANFSSVAPDLWANCVVEDWGKGHALVSDRTRLFSLHAGVSHRITPLTAGRKPIYDQDQINGAVAREIRRRGFPHSSGDLGWQSIADVERVVGEFCVSIYGREPAKSTSQKLARQGLEHYRRTIR